MQDRSARTWGVKLGVTTCIAIAGVIGSALPAQAVAVPATTGHAVSVGLSGSGPAVDRSVSSDPAGVRGTGSGGTTTTVGDETRSWASIIRTAINALKKIPALWKKVVDGAKKSAAWFKANVWPAIKATVNLVSTLLTAQEIWKFFN